VKPERRSLGRSRRAAGRVRGAAVADSH